MLLQAKAGARAVGVGLLEDARLLVPAGLAAPPIDDYNVPKAACGDRLRRVFAYEGEGRHRTSFAYHYEFRLRFEDPPSTNLARVVDGQLPPQ